MWVKTDSALSIAKAATLTLMNLVLVSAPQVILRAASIGTPGIELWTAYGAGLVGTALMILLVSAVTREVPRKSFHSLARTHIGTWAGIVVAAARIVAYALVVMMGVEAVATALESVANNGRWALWVPSVLALILALPVFFDTLIVPIKWATSLSMLGVGAIFVVLGYGVIQEALGHIDFLAILQARQEAYEATANLGAYNPLLETAVGALFPAAVVLLTSERIMVPPETRRLSSRQLLRAFLPLMVAIGFTMYFIAKLSLPGRRSGLPVMSIAAAFFGSPGAFVLAGVMAIIGMTAAYAAYRQLPRLLRELSVDGLLPRDLAATDATAPRRTIVLLIALVAAGASAVLDSTHAVAMVFIFICFVIALISAAAMVGRSSTVLNDSTHAPERRRARRLLVSFAIVVVLCLGVLALMTWIQPSWMLTAVVLLLVPGALLAVYRRGQGKLNEVLSADLAPADRRIPTRVHGIVLVERLDQPTLKALSWARATQLSSLTAVVVDVDEAATRRVREAWSEARIAVSLTVLGKPRGATRGPVIEHLRSIRSLHPSDVIQVFIPRVIAIGSWEQFYTSHSTPRIVSELRMEPGVMVTEVPYRLNGNDETEAGSGER